MSNSMTTGLIATTVVILVWVSGFGFAFNIDISPDQVSELVRTDEVSFTCKLDRSDNDVNEIMVLELAKDDDRIAVLRHYSELTIRKALKSKFKGEGNTSKSTVLDSYIRVTLTNPDIKDMGTYTCLVYYLDQFAVLKERRASGNLTVADDDLKSTVKYLVDIASIQGKTIEKLKKDLKSQEGALSNHGEDLETLKKLEDVVIIQGKTIEKQEQVASIQGETIEKLKKDLENQEGVPSNHGEAIEKLKADLKDQENEHIVRIGKLNNHIKVQEEEIDNLGRQMMQFNDRVNTTVFFTAWHTRTGRFKTWADMVYDDVVENVGGAYDGSTGKFTAPVDGLYFFDVSVYSYTGKWIEIDLKTSDGRLLTRLWDYDEEGHSYKDTSCVVKLYAGEYVHPVVRYASAVYRMGHSNAKDPLNKFYGFLIKTL